MIHFLKNVAVAGGFLQLGAFGAGSGASMRGAARSRCIGHEFALTVCKNGGAVNPPSSTPFQ
jgi:hypothetical protein